MTDREAIRFALQHAIEDRLSYLDSIRDCGMEDDVVAIKALIVQWRKLLKRRYGDDRLPQEIALEGTVLVDIGSLKP